MEMTREYWAELCDAGRKLCTFCESDECENCQVTRLLNDAANEAAEAGLIDE